MKATEKVAKRTITTFVEYPKVSGIDTWPDGEKKLLSWFIHRTDNAEKTEPILVYSPFARKLFGRDYQKFRNGLEERGVLECVLHEPPKKPKKKEKPQESEKTNSDFRSSFPSIRESLGKDRKPEFEGKVRYDRHRKLCSRFRFTENWAKKIREAALTEQWVKEEVKYSFTLSPISRKFPALVGDLPETEEQQEIVDLLLKNYADITIRKEWIDYFDGNEELSLGAFIHTRAAVEQIRTKDIGVSFSSTNRLYHPILWMRADVRQFLRVKGQQIFEVDCSCMHPYLLALYLTGDIKDCYLRLLNEGIADKDDIYEQLARRSGIDRKRAKQSFQVFLAGGKLFWAARDIDEFYRECFPEIIDARSQLLTKGRKFQAALQSIESEMCVFDAYRQTEDFFCLIMHDGLAITRHDIPKAIAILDKATEKKLGYKIPITLKAATP